MRKVNNSGFTLLETLLCFVILSIILIVASQIIHSSTETYYFNRSLSYGMQAAQIVSTEIRGELEDALPMCLYDINNSNYSSYYIKICNDEKNKCIEFIDSEGKQTKFSLDNSYSYHLKKNILNKDIYNSDTMNRNLSTSNENIDFGDIQYKSIPEKIFDSKYIGMGYEVIDISIIKFQASNQIETNWNNNDGNKNLDIGNYPVLELKIKVGNHQYDEYECKEYIPLYNFYGIIDNETVFESIINIS